MSHGLPPVNRVSGGCASGRRRSSLLATDADWRVDYSVAGREPTESTCRLPNSPSGDSSLTVWRGMRWCEWQTHPHGEAAVLARHGVDLTAVSPGDRLHDRQSETGPAAHCHAVRLGERFGGGQPAERLEQARLL